MYVARRFNIVATISRDVSLPLDFFFIIIEQSNMVEYGNLYLYTKFYPVPQHDRPFERKIDGTRRPEMLQSLPS